MVLRKDLGKTNILSGEEVKTSQRFNPQCFLLRNYHEINDDIVKRRNLDESYKIKNFAMASGEVSRVINMIAPRKIQPFLDLTPAQKAILQPYIRFFKVYKTGQKVKASEEFTFRIHSAAKQKIDGTANIDRITESGLGRIPDIGLKSVSFKESGGYEQAHVPATIIANIELYCNTLDSILINYKERGPDGAATYPFGKTEQDPPPPPLLDLISYSDKFANDNSQEDFDCFEVIFDTLRNVNKIEIHAHVGWSVPNNAQNLRDFKTAEEFKNFKTAIESSRAVLVLNLLKSEIDFQEDGSIRINGEYQARVESVMNNPAYGVLNFNSKSDEALKALIQDEKNNSTTNSFLSKPENIFLSKEDMIFRQAAASPLSTIKLICNQLKIDSTSTQALKNKKLLQSLITGLRTSAASIFSQDNNRIRIFEQMKIVEKLIREDKVFHWDVNFQAYQAHQNLNNNLDKETAQKITNAVQIAFPNFGKENTKFNSKTISLSGLAFIKNLEKLKKDLADASEEKDDRKSEQKELLKSFLDNNDKETEDGVRRISWFYLGDLFDLILNDFYDRSKIDDVKFILGPMQSPVDEKVYNLANLPISLDLFVQWWTKNVVIPGRTTYSLKNFIKDILSQIIAPATGMNCEFSDGSSATLQANYIIFHAPKDFKLPNGVVHTKEKMDALVKSIQASVERPQPEDLVTYVYVYALDAKAPQREGDKERDESDGIYHLSYGQDRGIVRRIQFKRVETRGRREALLEQFDSINNLAQHSERYNANIHMEGNGIFKPGMQVFINPYTSTVSKKVSPVKLVNALGLGGYYWISEVETVFEGSNYETIIECVWMSPGTYSPTGLEAKQTPNQKAGQNTYDINK